jgi:restriction system protein
VQPQPQVAALDVDSGETPEELIEREATRIDRALEGELLSRAKAVTPAAFEQLVLDLLVAMGYGGSKRDAALAVGRSGDGGIDGVIKEDALGLDMVYVQAKRWDGTVGRPTVQAFVGSLQGFHATKGVLLTTSSFSPDARTYVDRVSTRVVLVDGTELARLMREYGIGVALAKTIQLKRLDSDYFEAN